MNFITPYPHDLNWQLHSKKSDIVVHWAEVKNSPFKAVRGDMTVQASIDHCVNHLKNGNTFQDWIDGCIQSSLLANNASSEISDENNSEGNSGKNSDNRFIAQLIYAVPWPLKNVISTELNTLRWSNNGDGAQLHYQTVTPQHTSEKQHLKKCQPMKHTEGIWIIEAIDEKSSRISHAGFANPGGKIPASLLNSSALSGQESSFAALRKKLQQHSESLNHK
jgi:hypothetical protein